MPSVESKNINSLLSKNEITELLKTSDLHGWWSVVSTWAFIFLCLAAVAWRPSIWMILIVLPLMGGRQLALAILMHEASHHTLFSSKWLNDFIGQWFCSIPLWLDLKGYRHHHLQHHKYTWTENDPDLGLSKDYPVTRLSLTRKFLRDLFGLTALKSIYGYLLRDFGYIEFTISNKVTKIDQKNRSIINVIITGIKNLRPFLFFHICFFTILILTGHPFVYLIWWGSFLTFFFLFIRIRSIAEHAVIGNPADDFQNTRTTKANFLSRLFVAPIHVNYHLEHHLLMTVPHQNLKKMHTSLKKHDVFNIGNYAPGYIAVLKKAVI